MIAFLLFAGCGAPVSESEVVRRMGIVPGVILEQVEGTADEGIYLTFGHEDIGRVVIAVRDLDSLTENSDFSIGEISGFRPLVISCSDEGYLV